MASIVRIADLPFAVESATLELFNLFSKRPDWVLDAKLVPPSPTLPARLWLAGTGEPAPYNRTRRIDVAYLDAPRALVLDGDGTLVLLDGGSLSAIECAVGKVRAFGSFAVRRQPRDGSAPRAIEIAVDLVAAIVT